MLNEAKNKVIVEVIEVKSPTYSK
jgi:hypothetical protein